MILEEATVVLEHLPGLFKEVSGAVEGFPGVLAKIYEITEQVQTGP